MSCREAGIPDEVGFATKNWPDADDAHGADQSQASSQKEFAFSLNGQSREQVHLHRWSMPIQQNIRRSLFRRANIELSQVR